MLHVIAAGNKVTTHYAYIDDFLSDCFCYISYEDTWKMMEVMILHR